jgi:hypothetical protein
MKCQHCPLLDSAKDCKAITRPHPRYCELVDPTNPDHDPRYVAVLTDAPPEKPKLPGKLAMLGNLAQAVVTIALDGGKMADAEVLASRKAICDACPFLLANDRCSKCGCHLSAKRLFASMACPEAKWPAV